MSVKVTLDENDPISLTGRTDDPCRINKTKKAQQQLYHFGANEYAFYLKPFLGKEWVAIVRE